MKYSLEKKWFFFFIANIIGNIGVSFEVNVAGTVRDRKKFSEWK